MALQLLMGLPWIFVTQVSTAFVVSSNRSPARYQQLAWITVMILGIIVTLFPSTRETPAFVILVAGLPRVLVASVLVSASMAGVGAEAVANGTSGTSTSKTANGSEQHGSLSVALPRAARFALFACNGTTGEALNDMATDLRIRDALAMGDTQLDLTYKVAVLLSMGGGFVAESLASGTGARRGFAALWGLCQVIRGLGMVHMTPDKTGLMFFFVFFDKFSGPLGQAAIDTALLSLMRLDGGGKAPFSWPRIPVNAMWTLRTAAERLERPVCQLLLLRLGMANASQWVPLAFTSVAVGFVLHTFRLGASAENGFKAKEA